MQRGRRPTRPAGRAALVALGWLLWASGLVCGWLLLVSCGGSGSNVRRVDGDIAQLDAQLDSTLGGDALTDLAAGDSVPDLSLSDGIDDSRPPLDGDPPDLGLDVAGDLDSDGGGDHEVGTSDGNEPGDAELDASDATALEDADPSDGSDVVTSDSGTTDPEGVTVWPSILEPGASATIRYSGVLSGKSAVSLHYGFNGWNQTSASGFQSEDTGGNLNYFRRVAMVQVAPGVFEVSLDLPSDARALHMAFVSNDGGVESWDNNAGLDYNRAIVFPYIGPYLNWNGVAKPPSGLVITFQSGYPCAGRLEYGATAGLGNELVDVSPRRVHHYRLAGLAAGSTLYYLVGCGARTSSLFSYAVPPKATESFRFLALSDMQDNGDDGRWLNTAQVIAKSHGDARFMLIAGDMCWNDNPGHWWQFFDKGRAVFGWLPLVPALGNHDTPTVDSNPDSSTFERFFDLENGTGDETTYRLDFGHASIFALNSERPGDFVFDSGSQFDFVKSSLASLASAPPTWVFAFWHIPPYNVGVRHSSQQGDFRDLTSLFDGALDWVFCGHEHLYQRMKPLRYNAQLVSSYGRTLSDGVGYLVLPPAGVRVSSEILSEGDPKGYYRDRLAYPLPESGQTLVPSENGFVVVTVNGASITIQTIGLGSADQSQLPHVLDELSYTKP